VRSEFEAFLNAVAHDLRAPLRSIDGFSLVLQEDYGDGLDETGRDHLSRIRVATQKMKSLIDDLAELSLVGVRPLQVVEVDLSRIATEVLAKLRENDPERPVVVSISPGLRVSADPYLVRVILEKLINNALKFTARTDKAAIDIGSDGPGHSFRVTDNGAGFDMAYVDQVFTPFRRLHGQAQFPGNGLGLATAKRIAERHGGTVAISAVPDQGATCIVTFPARLNAA